MVVIFQLKDTVWQKKNQNHKNIQTTTTIKWNNETRTEFHIGCLQEVHLTNKDMDKIWNGREHYSKQIDTKRKSYKWLKYILVRSLNTTIVNIFLLNIFAHIFNTHKHYV